MPTELGLLTSLKSLSISNNYLTGTIPSELGISDIGILTLYGNILTGNIPSEFGLMSAIYQLDLEDNSLAFIPTEIGQCAELQNLFLANADLRGAIPSEIGNLSNLERVRLFGNHLSGYIPSEIGALVKLGSLTLHRNLFSGFLPSELGLLTDLKNLDVAELPFLTGTIPGALSPLATEYMLQNLNMTGNRLTGIVPEDLCFLRTNNCNKIPAGGFLLVQCALDFDCSPLLCGCQCICS